MPTERFRHWGWVGGFFAIALLLTFCLSIEQNLIIDENVFVTSAKLLNAGLLPYRDFHYNHMPTLVLIYAGLFRLSDHLLLTARCFNAACAAIAVTILFAVALRAFAFLPANRRLIWAGAIGLFYLENPMFTYTAGIAWNHDFALLCCLGGFLALGRALRAGRSSAAAALACGSGIALGLAWTTRLTFAPAMLPFTVYVLLFPTLPIKRRAAILGALAAGVLIATLPSVWFWMQSPQNAFFGNVVYPKFNTRWHFDNDRAKRLFTFAQRFIYTLRLTIQLPGNGILCGTFLAFMIALLRWRRILTDRAACEFAVITLLVLTLTATVFASAPIYEQYLYAATPFMLLGVLRGLALMPQLFDRKWFKRAAVAALVVAGGFAADQYDGLNMLKSPSTWPPMIIHATGMRIAAETPPGRILSLEPIYGLEGGRDAYPELSTGKFSIRASMYMSPAERARYIMPDTQELLRLYDTNPPVGMFLTALKETADDRMAAEAERRGYRQVEIGPMQTLWVRPNFVKP